MESLGYLFLLLIALSFLMLVWCVVVVIIYFIGFEVYGKIFRKPDVGKYSTHKKTIISVVFSVLIITLLTIVMFIWHSYKVNDYWGYSGFTDYRRVPLEYPYEISMFDVLECGVITVWSNFDEDSTNVMEHRLKGLGCICEYEKRGNLIAGYINKKKSRPEIVLGYFIFNCSTGIINKYDTMERLIDVCDSIGFNPPLELKTTEENYKMYWANPRDE